jgi:hypothetical protein
VLEKPFTDAYPKIITRVKFAMKDFILILENVSQESTVVNHTTTEVNA